MKTMPILLSLSLGFFANADIKRKCNIEDYQDFLNTI